MTKPTLLIIDDNEEFLVSMGRVLRQGYEVRCARSEEEAHKALSSPPDVVLLDAGFDDGDPETGIKFAEELRLYYRLQVPIVFLSVDSQERLARTFPVLRQDTPGTYFVKAPFELSELRDTIAVAKPITSEQLQELGFERCSLKEHCGRLIHDLRNAARVDKERALDIVAKMKGVVGFFAPQLRLEGNLEELSSKIANLRTGSDIQEVEDILSSISMSLSVQPAKPIPQAVQLIEKWRGHQAPDGFTHVLIVDDDHYPPARELELKGYRCRQVFSYEQACDCLERDPPDVFLCDYRLGENKDLGLELMNAALTEGVFVVMLSAGPIDETLPPGVAKCEEGEKFNASLIHALICERAEKSARK